MPKHEYTRIKDAKKKRETAAIPLAYRQKY